MTYTEKAIAGTWYTITCTAAATVTQEIEGETATLATLDESGTASFRATAPTITVETTGKYHILPTKAPAAGSIGGGGCVDGEKMIPLGDATELPMKHGVWYEYHGGDALTVVPAEWDYRIKTCYLLTTMHVQLNGVRWIDGEPVFSDEAAIYVFALQQIDHTRIAANLAYVYTLEN